MNARKTELRGLESIQSPENLKRMSVSQLVQLTDEIRARILEVVGKNGGHLASNLGVTELTVALHYCFDFKVDRLLWDVGHQCYPHKLLTGRNERFDSLRRSGGLSGFPDIHESPYDLFSVGHAGTSIATAVGIARGEERLSSHARVVRRIGAASVGRKAQMQHPRRALDVLDDIHRQGMEQIAAARAGAV